MIKKNRKKPATILSPDALVDAQGGTDYHDRRDDRVKTFLTEAHKLRGHTQYSTDGRRLYYRSKRLGKLDDLLP